MAKITMEFDTRTRAFSAQIDGKPVSDLREVYVSQADAANPFFTCEVVSNRPSEIDEGMTEQVRIIPKNSPQALSHKGAPESRAFAGFLEIDNMSRAQSQILDFFER